MGVWAAAVTVSLQDGCGFADRESAAWTCQRCRSEVSSGEPGPPRPRRSRQGPTGKRHLLSISCPLARGGGGGPRPPLQAQFSPRRMDSEGKGGRGKLQGLRSKRKGLEIEVYCKVAETKSLTSALCKAVPSQAPSAPPDLPSWAFPRPGPSTHAWGPPPCPVHS